jgi:hypothetical protein
MKSTVIKHIKELSQNTIPTPDAAGNFYTYPLQSLFTITHGGTKSGHVDLIKSGKFIITENDFKADKEYPSMSMTNKIGNQYRYKFIVTINEPKEVSDFKITGSEKALYSGAFKKEHTFMFNSFTDANEFYLHMANKLNLTDDTYKNKRYVQLVNDNAPEFTKEVYLDLISKFELFN